jgi:hypothetical protein
MGTDGRGRLPVPSGPVHRLRLRRRLYTGPACGSPVHDSLACDHRSCRRTSFSTLVFWRYDGFYRAWPRNPSLGFAGCKRVMRCPVLIREIHQTVSRRGSRSVFLGGIAATPVNGPGRSSSASAESIRGRRRRLPAHPRIRIRRLGNRRHAPGDAGRERNRPSARRHTTAGCGMHVRLSGSRVRRRNVSRGGAEGCVYRRTSVCVRGRRLWAAEEMAPESSAP